MVGVVGEEDQERGDEKGDEELEEPGKKLLSDKVRNSGERTLEYSGSNSFEGLMAAFWPRKRAKNSHRRIACMIWRFHCGHCLSREHLWKGGESGREGERERERGRGRERGARLTRFASCQANSCSWLPLMRSSLPPRNCVAAAAMAQRRTSSPAASN